MMAKARFKDVIDSDCQVEVVMTHGLKGLEYMVKVIDGSHAAVLYLDHATMGLVLRTIGKGMKDVGVQAIGERIMENCKDKPRMVRE